MNPEIHTFLKDLLKDADQTDLSPELEEQMIQDLNTRLEDRLILVAMDNLDIENQDKLAELSEANASPEDIQKFIQTNISNWEEVFANALIDFRNTYLGA